MTDKAIKQIVTEVGTHFRTLGGGQTSRDNPLVNAFTDEPLQFALGVDVEEVVRFVVKRAASIARAKARTSRKRPSLKNGAGAG